MAEKRFVEYDQCPICGDPLLIDKKNPEKLKCDCCGFTVSIAAEVDLKDQERLKTASDALRSYEFNAAEDKYNLILEDNEPNSEVYLTALFGKLLSLFGVVYIKDFNNEAIPTFCEYDPDVLSIKESDVYKEICNLDLPKSIKDPYYKLIDNLDKVYARIVNELTDKPIYDFFICTKISRKTLAHPTADGLTVDSSYASRFYDFLTKSGYNVFYSDKCCSGIEYDSQILSALLRSKKMLVISTTNEYLESSWVQSEWRRWINFINCGVKGRDSLILCFPTFELKKFDMPRVLRKVQRYTSEIDAINALTIRNIAPVEEIKKPVKEQEVIVPNKEEPKPVKKVVKNRNEANKSKEELYMLGEKYYEGDGVEQDFAISLKYFILAADAGDFDAQFSVGLMYGAGEGTKADLEKSFMYHKLAADNGHMYAQFEVGQCYKNGWGCSENINEAIKYFELSAKQGYIDAKTSLDKLKKEKLQKAQSQVKPVVSTPKDESATLVTTTSPSVTATKETVKETKTLQTSSENKSTPIKPTQTTQEPKKAPKEPEFNAYNVFKEAEGYVRYKKYDKAIECYQEAINHNNETGYYKMGECYEEGLGVKKNISKAIEYYSKAAELGHKFAYLSLAKIYQDKDELLASYDYLLTFSRLPDFNKNTYMQAEHKKLYDVLMTNISTAISKDKLIGTKDKFYHFANNSARSYSEKIYCLDKASKLGHMDASLDLAKIYEAGEICKKDYNKAIEYYTRYAKGGDLETQKMLAKWYEKGIHCTADSKKSLEFLEMAANNGDAASLKEVFTYYSRLDKYEKAFEFGSKGIDLDDEFIYYCAVSYETGRGTNTDYAKALSLYERIANNNKYKTSTKNEKVLRYYEAQSKVCDFILNGKGVPQDEQKAFELYFNYSKSGKNPIVLCGLGDCYLNGWGCAKNEEAAIECYKKAEELDCQEAVNKICEIYLNDRVNKYPEKVKIPYFEQLKEKPIKVLKVLIKEYSEGNIVKTDLEKAEQYRKEAALAGDTESLKLLIDEATKANNFADVVKYSEYLAEKGDMEAIKLCANEYYNGTKVSLDYVKAFKYHKILAEKGDSDSQCKVGIMFRLANGTYRDYVAAFKYYQLSVKQNNHIAQYELGYCYMYGYGCTKDLKKARELFELSAAKNYLPAQRMIGRMYYHGEGTKVDYGKAAMWLEKVFNAFGTDEAKYTQTEECEICMLIANAYHESDPKNKAAYIKFLKEAARRGGSDAKKILMKYLIFKY